MTFLMGSLCFPIQFDLTNFEKLLSVAKGNTSTRKLASKKHLLLIQKKSHSFFLFLVVPNIIPVG